MKNLYFLFLLIGTSIVTAQVGINTTNPLAQLHVAGTGTVNDGVIIPIMSPADVATLQAFLDNPGTTATQKNNLSGFMFFMENMDGENELWQCNRTTEKLEPVYRKPKAYVKSYLNSQPSYVINVDNHLEFDEEVIDVGNNFTSIGDASGATDPNLGGFLATRDGIFEIYAQYHTDDAVGTGEYGISIFKTPTGDDFTIAGNRQELSRTSYAFTANATAFNKVFRSASTIVELEAGDRIDVFFNSDSAPLIGGLLDMSSSRTFMTAKQIMETY